MGNKNAAMNAKFKAKEWQWQLKTEVKHLDKEIKKIQVGEAKLQKEIRAQADKGNVDSVQMLAKSVVKSRAAVKRLEKTKVSMHAVDLQLTTALATMNTSSALRLSADVMKKMNEIAKIPEIGPTMEEMRREMARCAEADDQMEEALKVEGEEDDAEVEVQRVLEEMALEKMGPLSRAAAASSSAESAPAAAVEVPPAFVPPARQAVAVGAEPVSVGQPRAAAPAPPPPPPPPAPPATQAPSASSSMPPEEQASALSSAPPPVPLATAEQRPPTEAAPPPAAAAAAPANDGGNALDDDLMRRLANLKDN